MPTRADAHKIGDIGESDIQNILLSCGWACDKVQSDYGDDLVVQPDLNGKIDSFKLTIQVKSTNSLSSFKTKTNGYSLLVPKAHAIKWLRSDTNAIVVIWDINDKKGLMSDWSEVTDEYQAYISKKNVSIKFDSSNEISKESLEKRVWQIRIDHYDKLISYKIQSIKHNLEFDTASEAENDSLYRSLEFVVFDFLTDSQIILDGTVNERFLDLIDDSQNKYSEDNPENNECITFEYYIVISIFRWFKQKGFGYGLPTNTVTHSGRILAEYLLHEDIKNNNIIN